MKIGKNFEMKVTGGFWDWFHFIFQSISIVLIWVNSFVGIWSHFSQEIPDEAVQPWAITIFLIGVSITITWIWFKYTWKIKIKNKN